MRKSAGSEVIESTAGQVAADLTRRGIAPDRRVIVTVEPDDWISMSRRGARPKMIAERMSDEAIDQLIKQAQRDVEPGKAPLW